MRVARNLLFALVSSPVVWGAVHATVQAAVQADEPAAVAQRLLATGKYEEAADAFTTLASAQPFESAIGLARVAESRGQPDDAERHLRAAQGAAQSKPDQARALAELARLALERGRHEDARKLASQSQSLDDNQLLARWVAAELLRATGQIREAETAYRWFIDYYNDHEIRSAADLILIGRAAAIHARWKRASDQFHFLVNELYPDVLKLDATAWQAHLEAGQLFLEKFNQAEADRQFSRALAINPAAAEAHAAIAHLALQRYDMDRARAAIDRALQINPNLLAARHAQADLLMANFQVAEAEKYLQATLALDPVNEETRARLAAAYVALDGYRANAEDDPDSRAGNIIRQVVELNPHAGGFFFALATRLEERRRFDAAEAYFLQALERMPRLVGPRAGLGMLYMRLGNEPRASELLIEAAEVDPFNLRVSNTLQVLEVLDGYDTLETEHFVIRFDPAKDKLLARYAARHLEQVYPELCKLLGYQVPGKSLFEIFSAAKNTSGHGWFSARMVGLPYIGTVGACAGKMVAMASPNDGQHKFNWARVLKHELVHVVNLQQTNFNIPHWFTEALAVWNEGFPRAQEWNALLAERVPQGEIFNLDNINLGFIRPETSENWQMAYCQAELYAELLLKKYGDDAFAKLLAAYADNLDTRAALKRCFGVEQADFEKEYVAYLHEIVAGLKTNQSVEALSLAELEQAVAESPDSLDLAARLAVAQVSAKHYPAARQQAERVLTKLPKDPAASYVLARLHLLTGEDAAALAVIEAAIDRAAPDPRLAGLLASLKLKSRDYAEAARWYQMLSQRQPDDIRPLKALARVYLLSRQDAQLAPVLVRLAELDGDDLTVRKKLADMALAAADYDRAAHWSRRVLDIDVQDPDAHRLLAAALLELGQAGPAVEEYEIACELKPQDPGLLHALADACLQAGDKPKARAALEKLRQLNPNDPAVADLMESLSE